MGSRTCALGSGATVPVYRRHRLVHLHVPKTAGTAIERLFHQRGDMVWGPASWVGEERRDGRWYEYQHLTGPELDRLSGGEFVGFARFAVVRDPYQRLVSDHLWRRAIKQADPDAFLHAFATFGEFVAAIPVDVDESWDALVAGASRADANLLIHLRPQHHYMQGTDGAPDRSVELVRYEGLPDELDAVLSRRGVDNDVVRRPPRHRLGDFFTPDLLRLVNERYRRDFARLGYPMLDRIEP